MFIKVLSIPDGAKDADGAVFTLEATRNKRDIEAAYRLRYDVYCKEMKSLDPKDYPAQQESDRYDVFSEHFLLRQGGRVVGTLRLIHETPWGFLMEEIFTLPKDIERSKMLEASRMIIDPSLRHLGLMDQMCDAAMKWSLEHGYTLWCLAIQEQLLSSRYKIGWCIREFGESVSYHNTISQPIIVYLNEKEYEFFYSQNRE